MNTKDKLLSSRIRLLLAHPFFGQLMMSLKLRETDQVPTAATDGNEIIYNPDFFDPLTREQCMFILAHEIAHLFLLHHTRRQNRDPEVWNMACITLDNYIEMWDGTRKRMSDIRPGDVLMSPLGPNPVLGVAFNGMRQTGIFNDSLTCTSDHKVLTDEGFKEAKNCSRRKVHIFRKTRDAQDCDETLQKSLSFSVGGDDRYQVQNHSRVSPSSRIKSRPLCCKEGQYETPSRFEREQFGILWRFNRWRGNHFSFSKISQKTKENLFKGEPHSYEHFIFSSEVSGNPWILWDTQDQQYGESLLEYPAERNGSCGVSETPGALFNSEEACMPGCNKVVQRAYEAAQKRPPDSEYVQACERSESFELKEGFFSEGEGNIQPVFDLITEKGVYIAEGIVVHNCDFAINLILKDSGFQVLKEALIDQKYKDWSTEKIYDCLMQNPEEQPQGGGEGKGGDQPWNIGGVMDATGKGGRGATKAEVQAIEASMKGKIQNAIASAKKAGNLPGCIERMIEQILEPKADWQDILQRFVSARSFADYNFGMCHTRQLHQYGIINPVLDSPELGDVNVIVDVSGSIRDEELAQFAGELSDVVSNFPGTSINVVYCDTVIQKVDTFEDASDLVLKAVGGGGTQMKPAFDYVADNFEESSCIILFSDSYLFDWDRIHMPEVPALMACSEKIPDSDTPSWIEVIDIS